MVKIERNKAKKTSRFPTQLKNRKSIADPLLAHNQFGSLVKEAEIADELRRSDRSSFFAKVIREQAGMNMVSVINDCIAPMPVPGRN